MFFDPTRSSEIPLFPDIGEAKEFASMPSLQLKHNTGEAIVSGIRPIWRAHETGSL
jgi:hypothetical protein